MTCGSSKSSQGRGFENTSYEVRSTNWTRARPYFVLPTSYFVLPGGAMNVPISWLRDFVDVELEPRALAARLTMAGVEVEALHEIGAEWDKVYVGYVEHVEQHPNADRLNLVRVVAGEHHLTVVTGAPNIAQGQKVPLALVGARLWD